MSTEENGTETPAVFLAELGKSLKERGAGDAELATIVADHLLLLSPAKDCVEQAKAAIIQLAGKRATAKIEPPNA